MARDEARCDSGCEALFAPELFDEAAFALECRMAGGQVRGILAQLRTALARGGASTAQLGNMEIALAEVLNNIQRHAMKEVVEGGIWITLWKQRYTWIFQITDSGHPMPGCSLPPPSPPDLGCAVQELPEGGFGWEMIRALSSHVAYCRSKGRNHLRLEFSPL